MIERAIERVRDRSGMIRWLASSLILWVVWIGWAAGRSQSVRALLAGALAGAAAAATAAAGAGARLSAAAAASAAVAAAAAAAQRQHQMQHRAAGDLVVRRRLVVVHLLAGEDEPLLRRRNSLLLLDALLDPLDLVRRLDVDLDLLAGQRLRREVDVVGGWW